MRVAMPRVNEMHCRQNFLETAQCLSDRQFSHRPPTGLICPSGGLLTGLSSLISDFPKNILVPIHPKSLLELFASHPTRGAYRDRHGRGVRMRWTRQRQARNVVAGRVGERPVSDQQHADERCCSVRRSRVVLTPRRWRQVRGVKSAQPGLDKTYPLDDGGKRDRKSTRARRKPLKPLRAGMPGDSGVLVVTRVRSTTIIAHETAGALGIRHSPRPPWAEDLSTARAHGAARS